MAASVMASEKNFSGATKEMLAPTWWTEKTSRPEAVIMSPQAIEALNGKIEKTKGTYCTDILKFPEELSRKRFLKRLAPYASTGKKKLFLGAAPANEAFLMKLRANAATAAVPEKVEPRFAVAVLNTPLSTWPVAEALYSEPNDSFFDENRQSSIKAWEPVAVLHRSGDGAFYFVASGTADGWVRASSVAFVSKEELAALYARDFYTVTDNRITTDLSVDDTEASRREFTMGTRLPAALSSDFASVSSDLNGLPSEELYVDGIAPDYSVLVLEPLRKADGTLAAVPLRLPLNASLVAGYLPYTKQAVLTQAFKMLGERYGWGGMFSARDCSAFIQDIYQSFGFRLPRNSGSQARVPANITELKKLSRDEKLRSISAASPGSLLRMPGHIMLLLGSVDGVPYVIHDAYAYGASGKKGEGGRRVINCVAVSDLFITRKNGSDFLDNLTELVEIR